MGAEREIVEDQPQNDVRRTEMRPSARPPASSPRVKQFEDSSQGRFVLAVDSIGKLPIPNKYFGAVFDFGMLHHVVD
jgi:hypothetical protein